MRFASLLSSVALTTSALALPQDGPQTVAVEQDNVLGWHNLVCVTISGQVWAQPVPFEMMLRTKLDLESGQVSLSELKV